MTGSDDLDGYPDSPAEELRPEHPPTSLEEADREREAEDTVTPQGAPPPDALQREDEFNDQPDADQLGVNEYGNAGNRPGDAANFEDNAAEWSRERG